MLQFAESWSWVVKTLVAVGLMAPLATLMVFFNKRFGLSGEAFFFAWIIGVAVAFICFAEMSSTLTTRNLVKPLLPFLMVLIMGVMLGGVANVFLAQAIPAASNPGLPWAIFSINTPIAYLLSYWMSKVSPANFPVVEFSWINFGGIIFLGVGLAMVMYKSG